MFVLVLQILDFINHRGLASRAHVVSILFAFCVAFVFCPDQGPDGLEGSFDLQAWGLLAYFSMQF